MFVSIISRSVRGIGYWYVTLCGTPLSVEGYTWSHEILVILCWSPLSVKERKEKRHVTQRGPPLAVHVQTDNWLTRKENLTVEMNNLNIMGRTTKIFFWNSKKKNNKYLVRSYKMFLPWILSFCIKINTWWWSTSLKHVVFENVIINKLCVRRNTKCNVMLRQSFAAWYRVCSTGDWAISFAILSLDHCPDSLQANKKKVYNSDRKISYAQVHF
jgi:hypothetical protein